MQHSFHVRDLPSGKGDSSRETEFLQELSSAYRDIYVSVLSIVGQREDADDVVQEVSAVLWEKFDDYEPGTNFRKWSCAFAFNIAKAFVRQQRRRRGYGLSDHALMKLSLIQSAGSELFELRRELLQGCLTKLRRKDHQFLMDCYGKNTSLIQYARSESVPISTVYTRLSRLRRRLMECINRSMGRNEEDY